MPYTFSPPPLAVPDFKESSSFQEWDTFVNDTTNDVIALEEQTVGRGKCQYYNPKDNPTGAGKEIVVTWNGFPKRIKDEEDNYYEVADKKDGWPKDDTPCARNQDEYLEWYVYKNDQGKITRIDFTCESPEYYEKLFDLEPEVCLKLYQTYISPDVELKDLYKRADGERKYDMYNKWNTQLGAMHLNCPPNSLQAEIQLAGDATIIRKDENGVTITDALALINCSQYGVNSRNSDPKIGHECNKLCIDGHRITLVNPVCLYIARVNTSGMETPDGSHASKYMKMVRGIEGKGLRYSLSVPASEGFTVSDITIGGIGIEYGGQIAEKIEMGLSAEPRAEHVTGDPQPAYPCPGEARTQIPKGHPLLQAHTILGNNKYCLRR